MISRATLSLLSLLLAAAASQAAVVTVTTTGDAVAADGLCSLREALENAAQNSSLHGDCSAGSGADTVVFEPSLFSADPKFASVQLHAELRLSGDSVSIAPPADARIELRGSGGHRLLSVDTDDGATFELFRTDLRGGAGFYGGGARVGAQHALFDDVRFYDNTTVSYGSGGGLYRSIGLPAGTLTLRNCRFEGNTTARSGGGLAAVINADDDITIENCRFVNNASATAGAAASVQVNAIAAAGTPQVDIVDSTFEHNSTDGSGGALSLAASNADSRVRLSMRNSLLHANSAAYYGGALQLEGDAQSSAVDAVLLGNSFIDNSAGAGSDMDRRGGAIHVREMAFAAVGNVIAGNRTTQWGGAIAGDFRQSTLPRRVALIGNTLLDNRVDSSNGTRTLWMYLPNDSSGWQWSFVGNVFRSNSAALPAGGECRLLNTAGGLAVAARHSVSDQPSCAFGSDDVVADPLLRASASAEPLHPLLLHPEPASPAIDAWPAADCADHDGAALTSDIVGAARPRNGDGAGNAECDAGAFELPDAGLLSVARAGDGTGRVLSVPAGIDCGSACAIGFGGGTEVALTAAADPGSVFAGWSGDCSGTAACTLEIAGDRSVTATFNQATSHVLDVAISGDGRGAIASIPSGIACAPLCSASFADGASITLSATPEFDASFTGWSGGGCTGSGNCIVTLGADTAVTAQFTATAFVLDVARIGSGSGSVTSDVPGIACPADCSELYPRSQIVTLTATAASDSAFIGWAGACSGSADCVLDMDLGPYAVDARFDALRTLAIGFAGSGTGAVSSAPSGISCPDDCSEAFVDGTRVTLSAVANSGSVFAGWSGSGISCPGTGTCEVAMTAARNVTATFQTGSQTLTVAVTDGGRVDSTPAGIGCPSDCSETYSAGAAITLDATPADGYVFVGWNGACTGHGPCEVTMDAATTVGASFATRGVFGNGFE